MIMHTFQFCRYLQEAPGEHTYLSIFQKRLYFPQWKLSEIRKFIHYKNKARGNIFEEKSVSEKFCCNKESTNDPTESNTINQSNTMSRWT